MVGVQVGDEDRINIGEVYMPLQYPERPVAHVHEYPPGAAVAVGCGQQVAARRGVWSRERAGASDDGQAHGVSPSWG